MYEQNEARAQPFLERGWPALRARLNWPEAPPRSNSKTRAKTPQKQQESCKIPLKTPALLLIVKIQRQLFRKAHAATAGVQNAKRRLHSEVSRHFCGSSARSIDFCNNCYNLYCRLRNEKISRHRGIECIRHNLRSRDTVRRHIGS